MPLVAIQQLSIRFRGPSLLDAVDCLIEPGEKIGLLGRNGAGKSTLLRIIAGQVEPDHGSVTLASNARVAFLPQEVPSALQGRVVDIVGRGLSPASSEVVDEAAEWQAAHKVEKILTRMELEPEATFEALSSGMKRRVLLAQTLVDNPDLLLLDEPTNHLDIEAIEWLEGFLSRWPATLMFITHDRQFLRNLATRIIEIEEGRLFDWSCDYDTFLRRKGEALAAEEKQNALFDKKLAQEEAWIRQGIKARRTRNEGRVRALKELRRQRSERREKQGTSNLQIDEGNRSGQLVVQAEGIQFSHPSQPGPPILDGFSTTIMRGDKVGIIGPNGCGKTTLLRILLGKLKPATGKIRHGSKLQIAYFDQLRDQLAENRTVEEEVGDGYQTIEVSGQSRHVLGYLQDFLFTPERARTQIKYLSGGERNRVLLAKLFAKPANTIVLDEPTNDLDSETLEMLEERLLQYSGTLLVVSHDREFLNNVVTSTIAFEVTADGQRLVREFVGGYDDWLRQRAQFQADQVSATSRPAAPSKPVLVTKQATDTRLSYKELKELEGLPQQIEEVEREIAGLHAEMAESEFYKQPKEVIAQKQSDLQRLEDVLLERMHRWEALESRAAAGA